MPGTGCAGKQEIPQLSRYPGLHFLNQGGCKSTRTGSNSQSGPRPARLGLSPRGALCLGADSLEWRDSFSSAACRTGIALRSPTASLPDFPLWEDLRWAASLSRRWPCGWGIQSRPCRIARVSRLSRAGSSLVWNGLSWYGMASSVPPSSIGPRVGRGNSYSGSGVSFWPGGIRAITHGWALAEKGPEEDYTNAGLLTSRPQGKDGTNSLPNWQGPCTMGLRGRQVLAEAWLVDKTGERVYGPSCMNQGRLTLQSQSQSKSQSKRVS
jgi:hypothetical protein